MIPRRAGLAVPSIFAAGAAPLGAQQPQPPLEFPAAVRLPLAARDRARNVAVNALLGAGAAGVRALVEHRPVRRALLLGAGGGATASAGKQIIGGAAAASGLAGRAVAAVGTSLAASATLPHGYAAVPLGPVLLEWRRGGGAGGRDTASSRQVRGAGPGEPRSWQLDWHVNLTSTGALAVALARGDRLDLSSSLWAGVPVVRRDRAHMSRLGFAYSGVTVLREPDDAASARREGRGVLAHETIHTVQWTQLELPAAFPAERALLGTLRLRPGAAAVVRHLDLGLLSALAVSASYVAIRYECHPGEREAYRLTRDPSLVLEAQERRRSGVPGSGC